MIEIETTIRRGLRVTARASVVTCAPREYPGADFIVDLTIYWPSGCECKLKLSDEDERHVAEDVFEAYREDEYFRGYDG